MTAMDTPATSNKKENKPLPVGLIPNQKERTFGNKMFDLFVWLPIQGIAVWAFGLWSAHEATSGTNPKFEWLRKGTSQVQNWLENKFQGPASSKVAQTLWGSSAKEWSNLWTLWLLVSAGGNLLLPVTKYLENRREKISNGINRLFNKPELSEEEIAKEPKQTWHSLIAGRTLATAGAFMACLSLGPKRLDAIQSWVGGAATSAVAYVLPKKDTSNLRKWADIAVLDLILTLSAALVTYLWSRAVARKHTIEDARQQSAPVKTPEENSAAPEKSAPSRQDRVAKSTDRHKAILAEGSKSFRSRAEMATPEPMLS